MTQHYPEHYEAENPIVQRFKIVTKGPFPTLTILMDDKEITVEQLVKISNQLASALNDRGCRFEVKR
jgi:hypothetical protein